MDVTSIVLAGAVTTLIVKLVRGALPQAPEQWREVVALALAVVSGIAFVLAFPALNVFAGQGSNLFAEQVASGFVIAASAGVIQFGTSASQGLVKATTLRVAPQENRAELAKAA